ncbi:MAG: glycosyltransferase family 4 protein, partial [Caldilineaceae bacterium]|nr:glycosyltransferase family 4 protein [Caldilineaceae bacterium]
GGITHLIELLRATSPPENEIEEVTVWSGQATLKQVPHRPWLQLVHEEMLDHSFLWRQMWQVARLPALAAVACDVLFTPGATPQRVAIPHVTMCQNMLPFEPAERWRYGWSSMGVKLRMLEHAQSRSFRQADGVIFLTQYASQTVQQRIGLLRSPQTIVPHGIADEFRLAPRPVYPIKSYSPTHPFRLVYVSIVSVYKHQWHVANAVAQLRQAGFPVVIDFVGPAYGPALHRLQGVLQRVDPAQEFIRYVGPVSYRDLPIWYHKADAFVYASSCENLPIILLEAMAAGLPIACSNRGPMPEVLGQAGLYFDPENVAEIKSALRVLLIDHELRQQFAQSAFEQSLTYTWARCAKETFEFIGQVAKHSATAKLSKVGGDPRKMPDAADSCEEQGG